MRGEKIDYRKILKLYLRYDRTSGGTGVRYGHLWAWDGNQEEWEQLETIDREAEREWEKKTLKVPSNQKKHAYSDGELMETFKSGMSELRNKIIENIEKDVNPMARIIPKP